MKRKLLPLTYKCLDLVLLICLAAVFRAGDMIINVFLGTATRLTIRDLNYSQELISANKVEQMTRVMFEEVHLTKPCLGSS